MHVRGCTGKVPFPSRGAADATLGRIWSKCKPGGKKLPCRTYQCDHCGRWHLTSQPLPQQRKETAA